jgi:hypothetical protein
MAGTILSFRRGMVGKKAAVAEYGWLDGFTALGKRYLKRTTHRLVRRMAPMAVIEGLRDFEESEAELRADAFDWGIDLPDWWDGGPWSGYQDEPACIYCGGRDCVGACQEEEEELGAFVRCYCGSPTCYGVRLKHRSYNR